MMVWVVARVATRGVRVPIDVVVPKFTWLSADSLVVQMMVAEDTDMLLAETEEMVGGVVSPAGLTVIAVLASAGRALPLSTMTLDV